MAVAGKSPAQTFALVFGMVYVIVAILGFAVTGFTEFASRTGDELVIFELNPLHNLAHLAIAAALLWSSKSLGSARTASMAVGAALLVLAILGFAGILVDDLLSLNASDNVLHLGTAAFALYFGSAGA